MNEENTKKATDIKTLMSVGIMLIMTPVFICIAGVILFVCYLILSSVW